MCEQRIHPEPDPAFNPVADLPVINLVDLDAYLYIGYPGLMFFNGKLYGVAQPFLVDLRIPDIFKVVLPYFASERGVMPVLPEAGNGNEVNQSGYRIG